MSSSGANETRDAVDAPLQFQVTWDAQDALTIAAWWAETLHWQIEPTDSAFIERMIAEGYASPDDTTTHNGQLVWKGIAAISPDPTAGPSRERMLFIDVPEPKATKNRLHLDVRTGDRDAARAALELRGATYVDSHSQGPHAWHVMRDPEGNEFCVTD